MRISIVTPCFNSSEVIFGAYESLKNLIYKDFEWILVDDASPDNGQTIAAMNKIKNDATFVVKNVLLTENYYGSKSVYEGTLVSTGEIICILDHDDRLLPDSLNKVVNRLADNIFSDEIAGVVGRCLTQNGVLVGESSSIDFVGSEGDLRFKRRFTSELIQFTRRDLILEYFNKMKPGYTNGFVWSSISLKYKWIYIDEPLRMYDMGYEYSFTNSRKSEISYPASRAEAIEYSFSNYSEFYLYNLPLSFKIIGSAIRYKLHAKINLLHRIKLTRLGDAIYFLAIPLGVLRFVLDLLFKKISMINNKR